MPPNAPIFLLRKRVEPRPRVHTLDYSEGALVAGPVRMQPPDPDFAPLKESEARSVCARAPCACAVPRSPLPRVLLDDPLDPSERRESTARFEWLDVQLAEIDPGTHPEEEREEHEEPRGRRSPRTARVFWAVLAWTALLLALGAAAQLG